MTDDGKNAFRIAKAIQDGVPKRGRPPEEGSAPDTEQVLAQSLVRGTRGYIERILIQANGCYEHGWFDACAVMIRRLLETLIIEVFEHHQKVAVIQNANGDFLYLRDLISKTLSEPSWNLSRNTKAALPRLKDIGDKSAHSRRYIAHRKDIEDLLPDLRVAVQELLYLAKLK